MQKWIIRVILILILIGAGAYYFFMIYPNKVAFDAYNKGIQLRESGKLDESVITFKKAIENKPDFSRAYSELASTYAQQKKYDEAITNAKKAVELDPNNGTAYYNLGSYYEEKSMLKEAAQAYRKFLSILPNDPEAKDIESRVSILESN